MKLYIKGLPQAAPADLSGLNVRAFACPSGSATEYEQLYWEEALIYAPPEVLLHTRVENGQRPGTRFGDTIRTIASPTKEPNPHIAIALRYSIVEAYTHASEHVGRKGIMIAACGTIAWLAEPPTTPDWQPLDLRDDTSWGAIFEALHCTWTQPGERPDEYLKGAPPLNGPPAGEARDAIKNAAVLQLIDACATLAAMGVPVTKANFYNRNLKQRLSIMLDLADLYQAGPDTFKRLRDMHLPTDNEHTFPGANTPETDD